MRLIGRIFIVFLAFVGTLTLVGIGATTWVATRHAKPEPMPRHIVLTIDLDRGIAEAVPSGPFGRFRLSGRYPLRDVIDALDKAATDDRVKALLVRASDASLGMAKAQEVREAVAAFRRSGKPAVLFSETIGGTGNGTVTYYVASAFQEVWLQPSGDLAITGFTLESPFLRGLLDELEVAPQFGARHEFKSAVEMFTHSEFSESSRRSLQDLLDSMSGQFVTAVAAERGLAPERVRRLVDSAPLMPQEALEAGLIDRLGYREDIETRLKGPDGKLIDAQEYLARVGGRHDDGAKIAVIYGVGAVDMSERDRSPLGGGEVLAADTVGKALREAAEDDDVKAILLRVDSPGGSYVASDTIWHAVHKARQAGKPVVVSMGSLAASGGYFIAMAGDRIVANPGTITGSIGVVAGKLVLKDFWQKFGVNWDRVSVGENAGMWSANQPFDEIAWQRLQAQLDRIYADFTGKAAEARGFDADAIDGVARGRIWSGADAQRVGLVDELGGFNRALEVVREEAGLAPGASLRLVTFPERKGPLEQLAEALRKGRLPQVETVLAAAATLARLGAVLDPVLSRMETAGAHQGELRLPPEVPTSGW